MQQYRLEPNTISYNAVISACEKAKQPEMAMELLEVMEKQRTEPDVITYRAAISLFFKKTPARDGDGVIQQHGIKEAHAQLDHI